MAFKTLTIDEEAYKRLVAAKASKKESFSQVIRRVVPLPPARSAGELLEMLSEFEGVSLFSEKSRDLLKQLKKNPSSSIRRKIKK